MKKAFGRPPAVVIFVRIGQSALLVVLARGRRSKSKVQAIALRCCGRRLRGSCSGEDTWTNQELTASDKLIRIKTDRCNE